MDGDSFVNNHLNPLLSTIDKENKTCFLVGDFNIDLLKFSHNSLTSDFYNSLLSYAYLPFILQPTRISKDSYTLIDNIFFNTVEFQTISGNLSMNISDHLPQFLIVKQFPSSCFKNKNVFKRDYKLFKQNLFRTDLISINWENIFQNTGDVNEAFNKFLNTINSLLDKHAPVRKLTNRQVSLELCHI